MKKYIILVFSIIMCLSVIGCASQNEDEVKDINMDEFEESMSRKYDLQKIDIKEDESNKKMTIEYFFNAGASETDMTAVKFESLVYYKPRENKYDILNVNIYNKDNKLVKSYEYADQKWTETNK
ncbi:MAG: hypothetical protein N4A68_06975 [Maledivibacter sp.]|nr:hypothetical protein [Maledivibacter sp.]